jgi:hypothetical protein
MYFFKNKKYVMTTLKLRIRKSPDFCREVGSCNCCEISVTPPSSCVYDTNHCWESLGDWFSSLQSSTISMTSTTFGFDTLSLLSTDSQFAIMADCHMRDR